MAQKTDGEVLEFLSDLRVLRYKTVRMIHKLDVEQKKNADLEVEQVREGLNISRIQGYLYCLIDYIGLIFNSWGVEEK